MSELKTFEKRLKGKIFQKLGIFAEKEVAQCLIHRGNLVRLTKPNTPVCDMEIVNTLGCRICAQVKTNFVGDNKKRFMKLKDKKELIRIAKKRYAIPVLITYHPHQKYMIVQNLIGGEEIVIDIYDN